MSNALAEKKNAIILFYEGPEISMSYRVAS